MDDIQTHPHPDHEYTDYEIPEIDPESTIDYIYIGQPEIAEIIREMKNYHHRYGPASEYIQTEDALMSSIGVAAGLIIHIRFFSLFVGDTLSMIY
jgi:hypothetical protein